MGVTWHGFSPPKLLFVQQLIHTNNKENSIAPYYWPLFRRNQHVMSRFWHYLDPFFTFRVKCSELMFTFFTYFWLHSCHGWFNLSIQIRVISLSLGHCHGTSKVGEISMPCPYCGSLLIPFSLSESNTQNLCSHFLHIFGYIRAITDSICLYKLASFHYLWGITVPARYLIRMGLYFTGIKVHKGPVMTSPWRRELHNLNGCTVHDPSHYLWRPGDESPDLTCQTAINSRHPQHQHILIVSHVQL